MTDQLYTQLECKWKKNSGLNGIWTHDLCEIGGINIVGLNPIQANFDFFQALIS